MTSIDPNALDPNALAGVTAMNHNQLIVHARDGVNWIQLLHDLVTELLKRAEELDRTLEKEGDKLSVAVVKRVGDSSR